MKVPDNDTGFLGFRWDLPNTITIVSGAITIISAIAGVWGLLYGRRQKRLLKKEERLRRDAEQRRNEEERLRREQERLRFRISRRSIIDNAEILYETSREVERICSVLPRVTRDIGAEHKDHLRFLASQLEIVSRRMEAHNLASDNTSISRDIAEICRESLDLIKQVKRVGDPVIFSTIAVESGVQRILPKCTTIKTKLINELETV